MPAATAVVVHARPVSPASCPLASLAAGRWGAPRARLRSRKRPARQGAARGVNACSQCCTGEHDFRDVESPATAKGDIRRSIRCGFILLRRRDPRALRRAPAGAYDEASYCCVGPAGSAHWIARERSLAHAIAEHGATARGVKSRHTRELLRLGPRIGTSLWRGSHELRDCGSARPKASSGLQAPGELSI